MDIKSTVTLNNGVEMDRIGFGGGGGARGTAAVNAVCAAVRAGYTKIDTAMHYNNEREIGEGIRQCGVERSNLFVATKIWYEDMCEERQEETFYKSLEALGLDYVDLYFLHWPLGEVTKSWRVLERLNEQGKIRTIGVCNFQKVHLQKLLAKANICPAVNQIESNPRFQQNEIIELCHKEGIVPEAWGPLGSGRDLGIPVLQELAQKYEKTTSQIILRWHLQRGLTAIPKSAHEERIRQNIDVYNFELEENDMQMINQLDTGVSQRNIPSIYRYDRITEDMKFE